MISTLPAPAARPPLTFDAVLTPHRSLTRTVAFRLTLTTHGRGLTVGRFLSAPERFALAQALRAALARLHGGPEPEPVA